MAYLGKTPSQAVRSRYFYTATGGETSLSGADNNGDTLIFADGNYVDVYLNGVLLVAGTDYNVNTTNTIAGLTALTASDIVEIVVYDTFSVFGGTFQGALTADSINADIFGSHQFTAKNVQGSTILKGTPVYIAGHSGNDSEIAIADADVAAKMPAFGIAATDIANNTKGNVVVFGNYIGIDTSAFAVGDELYVSNTGTLTTTRPSGNADKVQKIAKVIRSQSQNGQIFVMGAGRSNDTPNAITANSINLGSSTTVSSVLDEDAMTSNSATALATQQSIKAYVDNQIGSNNELSEILTNGNTTSGNNIAFSDNDSAIFGAGNDLTINHDGNNSFITDSGTGSLYIQGTSGVFIRSADGGENLAAFTDDGAATLYYDNAAKLATTATGIDVTGTGTMDRLGLGAAAHASAALLLTTTNQHIRLDNGGELGVIELESNGNLNIWAHGDGETINLKTGSGAGADVLSVVGNNVGIGTSSIASGFKLEVTGDARFGDAYNDDAVELGWSSGGSQGFVQAYDRGASAFRDLSLNNSMTITSTGDVLVGKTSAGYNVDGFETHQNGETYVSRSGTPMAINRNSSDGTLLNLYKDGSTVGSIGSRAGVASYIVLDPRNATGNGGSGLTGVGAVIRPTNYTGGQTDNHVSLGSSAARFKDLYLSGGVVFGTGGPSPITSNTLDDYEEGSWTATFNASTTTATGYYTKVGATVFFTVYGNNLNVTSTGTSAAIGGLPFTNNGGYTAFTISHDTYTNNAENGYIQSGGTIMYPIQDGTVSAATTVAGNPKYIMASGTYITDS